jgi:hypothetical protein
MCVIGTDATVSAERAPDVRFSLEDGALLGRLLTGRGVGAPGLDSAIALIVVAAAFGDCGEKFTAEEGAAKVREFGEGEEGEFVGGSEHVDGCEGS